MTLLDGIDFARPGFLWLAPLALLPWWARRQEALSFSAADALPPDRLGPALDALRRAVASLAMVAMVAALAGLGRPQTQIEREGRGAEIMILMDRSRSMDNRMLPADWRVIDPIILPAQARSRGPVKSEVARDLLARFVTERRADRFALMFFSSRPMLVVPFTHHDQTVLAGIQAGGVGRGLTDTDVGAALRAGLAEFEGRPYSGSRVILFVSDGGAKLDPGTRQRIAQGLARQQVALYWLYLRSFNSPDLNTPEEAAESVPEIAMHRFFRTLPTPYRVYQAGDEEELKAAVADVGRLQNAPLTYVEDVPRRDDTRSCLWVALGALGVLMLARHWRVGNWA